MPRTPEDSGRSFEKRPVDGNEVYVGGPNLLTQLDSEIPDHLQRFAEEAGQNAQTVVYLVRDGELIAAFAMADVIREESFRVVDALHDLGIEVAMLTGDSQDVANAVADELGIDTVFAEVLPEDKDEKVQELQDQETYRVLVCADRFNSSGSCAKRMGSRRLCDWLMG
ncbi:HAD-IC family P-type ATPase [Haloarcula sp. S1CR25-12]|jgi:Cu2+-exporting ATPase|uniref:HAD-IC family P-type ATPase n=1 Tax=Haloarcula saliterrae TaxID=2950534 RepID=A0ABU2FJE8_9EURY|nr:HAD-IC family P-type ATPase [Haloarcula sp. S1CR25-12]MDS0261830.1 HAD-IC family P-type ATPase [Haloarcula sp. S1CR25-12]